METAAIAFLDILGFKGIWQNRDSDKVLEILSGVVDKVKHSYKHPPEDAGWPKSDPPEITILSDTIVVVIKSSEPQCLFPLANLINDLFLYFWKHNLFLRGAVSWGEYSQSGSTFIGPAIDDVASWYEAIDWIGVVLTPKTNYLMDRFTKCLLTTNGIQVKPYIKYTAPGKTGKPHNLYSMNWPSYLHANLQVKYNPMNKASDEKDARMYMYKLFSEQPAFDGSVLEKYENTLRFIEYSIDDLKSRTRFNW